MNSSQKEEEGHKLVSEADKLVNTRSSFFKSLFGPSTSKEDAAEMYVRAANTFKLAKSWTNAASAFEKAAATYATCADLKYEAAAKYTDAGKAYRNVDPKKAIRPFESAVQLHSEAARFQQCARLKKDLAELYEAERDNASALDAYSAAADFYDMDDAKSNANTMRVKVASLNALAGNYGDAAETFESIAQSALTNNLLKYGARDHLLRAGLCRLCMSDLIGAQRAVEKYNSMDSSFSSSREGRLLDAVVNAADEGDVDAFTNHVFEYDSISKLDEWKTSILLKIKNTIKAEDEPDLT